MVATFISRGLRLFTASLLAAAVGLVGAPTASSDNKEALSSLEKSIVFLVTQWVGAVQVPPSADADGEGFWTKPLKYSVTCTGWYVSTSAQIVTAGHCVDPGQGRLVILDGFLHDQKATKFKDQAYANWRVEGAMGGSPVERTVRAIQPNGVDGATITSPTTVEVVDFKAPDAGDVALLHVPNMTKSTPGLVIAQNAPQVGDPVTSIGFPGDIQDIADQSQIARASFKSGTISSNQVTPSGVVQIEVSTELAPGMSGGPTVNKDGQVVGVNSRGLTTAAGFNFITNTPDLRSFALSHNVTLVKPPAPPDTGLGNLWYIVGGVALVGVGALLLLMLLVRRRRRRPQFAGVGGPPMPGYPIPPPSPVQGWAAPIPPPPPPRGPAGPVPPQPIPRPSNPVPGSDSVTTEIKVCAACGAPRRQLDRFCTRCGKPVS
ncbi:hypothetical protein AWB95_06945 [Mycobacterium celatum]|uniref:Serine protease n=1 Tax=Mycobacterium celatum TaxID=28045 RepID=A0A1X1RTW1_MYCCE|nr:hypothetical protein AWB95_06945 [Mycobacterium celatum]PIB77824.1 serine protease [Mycobacterium celatum]